MTSQAERLFPFEAAGRDPQYIDINRAFVNATLDVRPGQRILDVACGTALITQLVRDRFNGTPATIIGVDPNPVSLSEAKQTVQSIGETKVHYVQATGQDLPILFLPESFDQAYIGNGIHEFAGDETKLEILQAISSVLKPGGTLAVNSTFMREAMQDTARAWGEWKLITMQLLGAKRNKDAKPFEVLPTSHYTDLMQQAGLEIVSVNQRPVQVGSDLLRAIAQYGPFIQGVCGDFIVPESVVDPSEPDYEVHLMEKERDALIQAVGVMETKHKERHGPGVQFAIGRNWTEIVAKKPVAELPQAA